MLLQRDESDGTLSYISRRPPVVSINWENLAQEPSTRVIITNLPSSVDLISLRTHLTTPPAATASTSLVPIGSITDLKIYPKRRFAFVGYKTADDAARACHWWNGTWLGGGRISCELVDQANSLKRPVPQSDFRDTQNQDKRIKLESKNKSKVKGDESFAAYASVMNAKKSGDETSHPLRDSESEDDNVTETATPPIDDSEWLKSKMTDMKEDEDGKVDPVLYQDSSVNEVGEEDPDQIVAFTARLFLRNLVFSVTERELRSLMEPFGEVVEIHLPVGVQTRQPLGTAFIQFKTATQALSALHTLDGQTFQGRILHILPGREKLRESMPSTGGAVSAKAIKEQKKRTEAGKDFNWAMLYMNSDAVVDSVADRMKLSKADLIGADSDNPAVKLALAETHVIEETKRYLEEEGVNLDAFSSRSRSSTTILVKNMSYGTSLSQLTELFSAHGNISRLLVPPAGTIALVEFTDHQSAESAFKSLAYRRLGTSILYLEKAPDGLFSPALPHSKTTRPIHNDKPTLNSTSTTTKTTSSLSDTRPATGTTLFVKNLNFSTTTQRLSDAFSHLPFFTFAQVQTKPDMKSSGRLSLGFGFVGFKNTEAAESALKTMDGFLLDGHKLEVQFSQRNGDLNYATGDTISQGKSSKIMVKNIPFEATKKDIQDLFNAYGQVKSVRLPRKFDTKARGFAFLEFVSRRDAEAAFSALKHTHLLGRHLVLEWADGDDTDIAKMREKVSMSQGDSKLLRKTGVTLS